MRPSAKPRQGPARPEPKPGNVGFKPSSPSEVVAKCKMH